MGSVMSYILLGAVIVLAVYIFICMIRVVIGPKVADRIIAANMICTLVIIIIVLLAAYLNETGLLDVALIYAMISFIAVVVLTKVYLGVYMEHKSREKKAAEETAAENGDTTGPGEVRNVPQKPEE